MAAELSWPQLDQPQPSLDTEKPSVYTDMFAAQVYFAAGDLAAMRTRLTPLSAEWWPRLEREPANPLGWATVEKIEALLGHPEEAVRLTRKAPDLMPVSRDAFSSAVWRLDLAMVYAVNGDKDHALAELSQLVRIPMGESLAQVRAMPAFAKLRGDPQFEALFNDPNNMSLF